MPPRKPSHPHNNPKRPRLHPSKPLPQTSHAAPPSPYHLKPTIPFLPTDHILLVGEGDFSFAHSLLNHHAFTSLVATSLDSRDVVLEKYPHAVKILRGLENWGLGTRDEGGGGCYRQNGGEEEEENENEVGEAQQNGEIKDDEKEGDEETDDDDEDNGMEDEDGEEREQIKKEVRVKFGVDATKLTRAKIFRRTKVKKKKNKGGPPERGFDKIVFNFPHVGGKTKDVNRQVRYNQDLLVSFLTTSLPLLAPAGVILVTLFEGLPYSLWNIRDLARHVGLKVGRSFKFDAGAYPGYRHARTGGVVKGRRGRKEVEAEKENERKKGTEKDEEEEENGAEEGGSAGGLEGEDAEGDQEDGESGESGADEGPAEKEEEEEERRGWKGEERAARTYIFELAQHETKGGSAKQKPNEQQKKRKKRKRGSETSTEDEDEDD